MNYILQRSIAPKFKQVNAIMCDDETLHPHIGTSKSIIGEFLKHT